MGVTAFVLLLFPAGQELAQEVSRQIRDLGAEEADIRDAATDALITRGPSIRPLLEKALSKGEPEKSVRIRFIIRVFELQKTLPPRVRTTLPGVEKSLASGAQSAWTKAFLSLIKTGNHGEPVHPDITSQDLAPLVHKALKGALTELDKAKVCVGIGDYELKGAGPDLVPLLGHPSVTVRSGAGYAFLHAKPVALVPQLHPFLKHKNSEVRWMIVDLIRRLNHKASADELLPLLGDPAILPRFFAAGTLAQFGEKRAIPGLRKLLSDKDVSVKHASVSALGELNAQEAIPDILRLLGDETASVRGYAVKALGQLRAESAVPEIERLLSDSNATVRKNAQAALDRIQGRK